MSEPEPRLAPPSLGALARRALREAHCRGAVFDLDEQSWYRPQPGVDLSGSVHGRRLATVLGPGLGAHGQLAHTAVVCWLAGCRTVELAPLGPGANRTATWQVDASAGAVRRQRPGGLGLTETLDECVKANMLVRILAAAGVARGLETAPVIRYVLTLPQTGHPLDSAPVAGLLDGLCDAERLVARWRRELVGALAAFAQLEFPTELCGAVALSVGPGSQPKDLLATGSQVLAVRGLPLVLRVSSTVLGRPEIERLLRDELGFESLSLAALDADPGPGAAEAVELASQLGEVARRHGQSLTVQCGGWLPITGAPQPTWFDPAKTERLQWAGRALFPVSLRLAAQLRGALDDDVALGLSGGVDARSFADAVACGLAPITLGADLLRPGGYARLSRCLGELAERMAACQATTAQELILRQSATRRGRSASPADPPAEQPAALVRASQDNLAELAQAALGDARYAHAALPARPRKIGSQLELLDCIGCDKCVSCCPHDANFAYVLAPASSVSEEAYVTEDGAVGRRAGAPFRIEHAEQYATFAPLCDDCGNCDVFCPEDGGPHRCKPRLHTRRELFEQDRHPNRMLIERSAAGLLLQALVGEVELALRIEPQGARATLSDGSIELTLDPRSAALHSAALVAGGSAKPGQVLSTCHGTMLLGIAQGVLDPRRASPVRAELEGVGTEEPP